jgi:hypothetical protein
MTNLRWAILATALAWIWAASLLPGRPVSVHATGLPAAALGALRR